MTMTETRRKKRFFLSNSKNGKIEKIDVSRSGRYGRYKTLSFLFEYQGNNISSIDIKEDNESYHTLEYTYDNNNRVASVKEVEDNKSTLYTVDWVQDSAVVKVGGEEYFTANYIDGRIKSISEDQEELYALSYDANGNIIKEELSDRNFSFSWKPGGTRAQAAASQAIADGLSSDLKYDELLYLNPKPEYSAILAFVYYCS